MLRQLRRCEAAYYQAGMCWGESMSYRHLGEPVGLADEAATLLRWEQRYASYGYQPIPRVFWYDSQWASSEAAVLAKWEALLRQPYVAGTLEALAGESNEPSPEITNLQQQFATWLRTTTGQPFVAEIPDAGRD